MRCSEQMKCPEECDAENDQMLETKSERVFQNAVSVGSGLAIMHVAPACAQCCAGMLSCCCSASLLVNASALASNVTSCMSY